jgi:DNA-binding winged helix-turn-helix (wHTH) protein/Tol biopolymer transport system component
MAAPVRFNSGIRFGVFELDASSGELRKAGIPIKLRTQAIQLLLMFAERAGHVVTREEIRGHLWSDDTFVDFERSINFCVNQIRAALGDHADKPRYIETLPRRGYRFIASVVVEGPSSVAPLPIIGGSDAVAGAASSAGSAIEVAPSRSERVSGEPWTRKHLVVIIVAVVLASLATGFWSQKWLSRNKGPNFLNMRITKLTNSGKAVDVAISPDGSYVAYARRDGEKHSLWLRHVATDRDVEIAPSDTTYFHGITFTPDASYIYFVRSDKKDPFFRYLYAVPVLGGAIRKLITDVDSPVTFSPDGHQFVYEHCMAVRDDIDLKIAATDGSGERSLAILHNGTSAVLQPGPSWSPDGRTIAVPVLLLDKRQRWVLDVVSVADGTIRELYSGTDEIGRPVWLTRGDTLLVPLYDPLYHRAQLWTISFPEGRARRFTNDLTKYGTDLAITRDGASAAAIAWTTDSNVWVAPAANPLGGRQITSGQLPMFDAAENSDGKILAASGDGELWSMNPDGSQRALFTDVHSVGGFTPCGQSFVLVAYESGTQTIMRVDGNGTHSAKVVNGNFWSLDCSPDGKFIFYETFNQPQKIWKIPVTGGVPLRIADVLGDGVAGRLSVSPDGKLLAYSYTQFGAVASAGWKEAVISVAGGPPVRQLDITGEMRDLRWAADGKSLEYLVTENGTTNIWKQPLTEGRKPERLTDFTSGIIFSFNWSSDRTRLLLTRGGVSSDVVLLSNLR